MQLSQDLGYVMYSAFGSFYIPSCIMVFVYIKIYYAARDRARRVINKPAFSKRISRRFVKANNAAALSAAANKKAADEALAKKNISTISNPNVGCVNTSPSNNTTVGSSDAAAAEATAVIPMKVEKKTRFNVEATDSMGEDDAFLPGQYNHPVNKVIEKKKLVHILSATSVETASGRVSDPCEEPVDVDQPHAYGACAVNGGHPRPRRSVGVSTKDDLSVIENDGSKNGSFKDNSSIASSTTGKDVKCLKFRLRTKFRHGGQRRPSKETREVIDMGKLSVPSNKKPKKSPLNGILKRMENKTVISSTTTTSNATAAAKTASEVTTTPNNNPVVPAAVVPPPGPKLTHEQEAEKEKKRIARKKERRATLILGLIMGSFIACWFPFFFLYSISPICPICENSPDSPCCVQAWGFSFAFWLGYSNSALNPVIYTIFNKDFRRAFKRILFK